MCVCQPSAAHAHTNGSWVQVQDLSGYQWMKWVLKNKSTSWKIFFTSLQTKVEEESMNNIKDNNAVTLKIWMPVRDVCVCICVFGGCVYILIPSCWLSWDRVFLIRSAVSRAAPLAYQHSLIIFAITRRACRGDRGQTLMWHNYRILLEQSDVLGKALISCSINRDRCDDAERSLEWDDEEKRQTCRTGL